MRIQRLSSTHFRNLVHAPLPVSPGVNLFVGDNGHGKTNVLEALQFFKFGRSFRTARDSELIRFKEPFCRLEVAVEYSNADTETFAASIQRDGSKTIKVNEQDVPKLSVLVGQYPCVLFGPQDLSLVSGGPAERRRFADMTGSMTNRTYLDELRAYRRVLTQRNAGLKRGITGKAQDVWDEELVHAGCKLVERRRGVVEDVAHHVEAHVRTLGTEYPVEMSYESDLAGPFPNGVSAEEHFTVKLAASREEELRRRTTLVGPHRDDVRLMLRSRDLRRFGSQGQKRLLAVLLRLAEMSYLEAKLGEPCVLLLDDLFSELDDAVSAKLQSMLDGKRQLFVTSPVMMKWLGDESKQVYRVVAGTITAL
ncbi:MAG: DNA replication and repair protein RecF [Candidatus Latescibacterota bacterium]|nr:MAG: DNA replication and repair protein RecF [Candidatus Latescibacterota bacterium]